MSSAKFRVGKRRDFTEGDFIMLASSEIKGIGGGGLVVRASKHSCGILTTSNKI